MLTVQWSVGELFSKRLTNSFITAITIAINQA